MDEKKLVMKSPYDFYKLSDDQAKLLVGKNLAISESRTYIPVHLLHKNSNYGKQYGLLIITSNKDWLKVGAFSPDDLDIDLVWRGKEKLLGNKRKKITRYIQSMNLYSRSYTDILLEIQAKFGGELYN